MSYYISSRLPVDLRERMQALGDSADTLAILEFAADAGISEIAEEAGACVFWWNHPQADEKFFSWAAQESAGRVYTFPLLEHLWKTYNVISAAERLKAEPQPTPEELDQLSDEQVDSLLTRTRILRSEKSRLNEIDRRQSTCGLGP